MYDTLILVKPAAQFSVDNMEAVVREVGNSGGRSVERQGTSVLIKLSGAYLTLDYNDESHVREESQEIADAYGIPCGQCAARFEMSGDDGDMVLFNDYVLINERLDATGHFFIFDPIDGRLFGS